MYKFTVVSFSIVCKFTKSVHSTVKGALIGMCTHTVQCAFIQFCTNIRKSIKQAHNFAALLTASQTSVFTAALTLSHTCVFTMKA